MQIQMFDCSQDQLRCLPCTDIRFVCDTMLHRLGNLLRSCGIDTAIVTATEKFSFDECIRLAVEENYFLLSRGSKVKKV